MVSVLFVDDPLAFEELLLRSQLAQHCIFCLAFELRLLDQLPLTGDTRDLCVLTLACF